MIKRIKSDTVQSMGGLWLAYLLFLLLMHRLRPDDAWAAMLCQPVFLVFVPLVVACVPLLAARPDQDCIEDEDGRYTSRATRRGNADAPRRMALVWLVSLIVIVSPHFRTALDPVLHQPVFLVLAPLLAALASLLVPVKESAGGARAVTTTPVLNRALVWRGLVASIILAMILILCLVLLDSGPSVPDGGWTFRANIAVLICLVAVLAAIWRFVKQLKTPQ